MIVTAAIGAPAAILGAWGIVLKARAAIQRANQPYDTGRNILQRARDILEAKIDWLPRSGYSQLPKSLINDWDAFLKIKTEGDDDEPDQDS